MSNIVRQVFDFDGRALTAYMFRGRECWIAQDVAAVLGYEPSGWRSSWRDWTGGEEPELSTSSDFDVLRGPDLREFKRILGVSADSALTATPNLTVLYESGINLVCIKTDRPLGKKLRRFLADKVLPALRRASADADRLRSEIIELNLRIAAVDQPTIWEIDVPVMLSRLYRKPWDGKGRWPQWLAEPLGRIYDIVLGPAVCVELRSRNQRPQRGTLHYQFLSEARHRITQRDMIRVATVLRMSSSRQQFFARLETEFGRAPLQLEMGAG